MGPPTWLLVSLACELKNMDKPEPESEQKCSLRGGVAVPIQWGLPSGSTPTYYIRQPNSG
jgi:hypothetical protein